MEVTHAFSNGPSNAAEASDVAEHVCWLKVISLRHASEKEVKKIPLHSTETSGMCLDTQRNTQTLLITKCEFVRTLLWTVLVPPQMF